MLWVTAVCGGLAHHTCFSTSYLYRWKLLQWQVITVSTSVVAVNHCEASPNTILFIPHHTLTRLPDSPPKQYCATNIASPTLYVTSTVTDTVPQHHSVTPSQHHNKVQTFIHYHPLIVLRPRVKLTSKSSINCIVRTDSYVHGDYRITGWHHLPHVTLILTCVMYLPTISFVSSQNLIIRCLPNSVKAFFSKLRLWFTLEVFTASPETTDCLLGNNNCLH